MVGVKLKHGLWILPISIIAVISCMKEDIFNQNDKLDGQFNLTEARRFFEDNASDLRLVDLKTSKEGCPDTKAADLLTNIVPEWDKATQVSDEKSILYEVPLRQSEQLGAVLMKKNEKNTSLKKVKIVSSLIIQKFPKIDSIRYFVVTILGEHDGKGSEKEEMPYSYTGDRRNFTGFMVISDVDGCYLESYYYGEGKRKCVFLKAPEGDVKNIKQYKGFSLIKVNPKTKGGSYKSGETGSTCPVCGALMIGCTCPVCYEVYIPDLIFQDDGVYCPRCLNFIGQCTCSQLDYGGPPACEHCGRLYCNGDCVQYCSICGSRLENGVCPGCSSSGGGDQPPADTKCTVSISVDGGGSVTGIDPGTYEKGKTIFLTALSNGGYDFVGWYKDGNFKTTSSSDVFQLSSNTQIKAVFMPKRPIIRTASKEIEQLLITAIDEAASRCIGQEILNRLFLNNFTIDFSMGVTGNNAPAEYTRGGKIVFNNLNSVNFDNLIEELIHALQESMYTYDQMLGEATNIEFEAKFIKELCFEGTIILGCMCFHTDLSYLQLSPYNEYAGISFWFSEVQDPDQKGIEIDWDGYRFYENVYKNSPAYLNKTFKYDFYPLLFNSILETSKTLDCINTIMPIIL